MSVTALTIAPIKGTRLRQVQRIELGEYGARGDRRFFLIDDKDRMLNAKALPQMQTVEADFDDIAGTLTLRFEDGREVREQVATSGPTFLSKFYSGSMPCRMLLGPFSQVLSDHTGRAVRLVQADTGADRPVKGAASLYSRASLARLAQQAGVDQVDGRRFRMLIEIDGIEPHAEDRWVGRSVQVGDAVVHFEGHVGRCLVTTRDPDTGITDLPTLDLLRAYRADEPSTEPLPFGVYGRVVKPGTIAIGDPVKPI